MNIIDNDHVVAFDVDDSLVMWIWDQHEREQLSAEGSLITVSQGGFSTLVKPHKEHVELLKRYKAKGKFIIVWSQSGYHWCQAVVEALELEGYVDLCLTKPEKYIDDLDANEWMEKVYIGDLPKRGSPN